MKYFTKIALLTLCCCLMSGCMITKQVMTIGERYEDGAVNEAYMLDKNHVLLRSKIKICKNTAPKGSFNHVCKEPFYRDSIWKLKEYPDISISKGSNLTKTHAVRCNISTKYIGDAIEVTAPVTTKDDANPPVKLNFVYDSWGSERTPLLCSGIDNLFATDHTRAASLYLKNNDIYILHSVPYPKLHDDQDNLLVVVRYIILPVALVADVVTSPIQFILELQKFVYFGG